MFTGAATPAVAGAEPGSGRNIQARSKTSKRIDPRFPPCFLALSNSDEVEWGKVSLTPFDI
jgi:hypothetical protein